MKLTLGENIRRLRREKNMTQEQLAEALAVSFQAVSRWENSATYPDIELLPAIAERFSVSVDELLGIPESEKEKQADALLMRYADILNYEYPSADEERRSSFAMSSPKPSLPCGAIFRLRKPQAPFLHRSATSRCRSRFYRNAGFWQKRY